MAGLTPLAESEFDEKVNQASSHVLVEFGAPWCGPCKSLEPVLAELAAAYQETAFYSVDVDQCPGLVMRFGVMSVPTLILFKDGEVAQQVTGYKPRAVLEKALFKH